MEVKLIFRNFKKILKLNYEHSNSVQAFKHLKSLIKGLLNMTLDGNVDLYWKDKENDFVFFDSHDEFGLALDLNKEYIEIYVCNKNDIGFWEKCSNCKCEFNYAYQCLSCKDTLLCHVCFESHSGNGGHFGILEKSSNYQIHPFFYRELKVIIEGDFEENTIANIKCYFQKLIGNFGISFTDNLSNCEETPRNSPDILKEGFTMESLNLKTTDNQCFIRDIDDALNIMKSMGFTNDDDWLKDKLIELNCDILKMVDWIDRQVGNNGPE